ncbi:hypothetical protein [Stenotrophomonas maltophilia]|uniref:hypothetical protein n=1 Tax=Stenotrophomonas maltophilia TaxID=40324 RepID=UPI00066E0B4D|nr:hypothetical protein [Stenotrophomonas maltophilia]
MPAVLIVGTSHEFQRATPNVPPDVIDAFRDYLRQVIVTKDVVLIAEEMSSAGLAENGLAQSVAQHIAGELGIAHDLADPSPEDRERLGIQQRNEIELAGFFAGIDPDEVEAQVRRSYDIRENFWVSRLVGSNHFPVVFICGAPHVNTFRDKLLALGHDVVILADNWVPDDGPSDSFKRNSLR